MTFAMGGCLLKDSARPYLRHPALIILSLCLLIGCMLTIMFNVELRRKVPHNYILLGLFTFGEAFAFAGLTSKMEPQAVVSAIMALAVITGSIFAATWNMKDCDGFARQALKWTLVACIVQIIMLFFMIFIGPFVMKDNEWTFWMSIIMIGLASVYLFWDLCYVIIPDIANKDDYVFAALRLYLDIA